MLSDINQKSNVQIPFVVGDNTLRGNQLLQKISIIEESAMALLLK